jgi:membrane-associated phospholipid phosphatase
VQARPSIDLVRMSARMTDPIAGGTGASDTRAPRSRGATWLVPLVVGILVITAAHLLDQYAWTHWRDPRVNERDWGRLLRSMGYLPLWIVIAVGMWTHDRPRAGWRWRGGYVLAAPLLAGALAELLKMGVRRLRPDAESFGYAFRPFTEDLFSTRGLGMPSSHVMVAFAGAAVLAQLFPRARWLWYLLAAGCAATRVLSLGHFLSDVAAAAFGGWFIGRALAGPMLRRGAIRHVAPAPAT